MVDVYQVYSKANLEIFFECSFKAKGFLHKNLTVELHNIYVHAFSIEAQATKKEKLYNTFTNTNVLSYKCRKNSNYICNVLQKILNSLVAQIWISPRVIKRSTKNESIHIFTRIIKICIRTVEHIMYNFLMIPKPRYLIVEPETSNIDDYSNIRKLGRYLKKDLSVYMQRKILKKLMNFHKFEIRSWKLNDILDRKSKMRLNKRQSRYIN